VDVQTARGLEMLPPDSMSAAMMMLRSTVFGVLERGPSYGRCPPVDNLSDRSHRPAAACVFEPVSNFHTTFFFTGTRSGIS